MRISDWSSDVCSSDLKVMEITENQAPPEFETTEELATRTSTRVDYWSRLRLDGSGPPYVKFGRLVRYRRIDTDAWFAERLRRSTFEDRKSTRLNSSH